MSTQPVKVLFLCPTCERPGTATAPGKPWLCPGCDHALDMADPERRTTEEGTGIKRCGACGCEDIFKKKGFPHWLGLTILTVACGGFLIAQSMFYSNLAWGILLVSALIDGLLYWMVPDVAVCYRCGAQHRGIGKSTNEPFELTTHERYRQERIRSEELTTPQPGSKPS